jgi:hypothetical protein
MGKKWDWQVRVNLKSEFATVARTNPSDKKLKPLMDVLKKHDAVLKNQFDAFADFLPQFKGEMPHMLDHVNDAVQSLHDAEAKDDTEAAIEALKDYERNTQAFAERLRLYLWTKELVENPAKEKQYGDRFTVYADGGKEVYSKKVADALVADLQPLVDSGMITQINKFDTNPAKNPQAPKKFRI